MGEIKCPYCNKPYPTKTINGLMGKPIVVRIDCECEGAITAKEKECAAKNHSELVEAWRRTNVPRRYDKVLPDSSGLESLTEIGGYYLYGPKGRGKTYSACRILKAYVKEHQRNGWTSARFISVPDWLGSMRAKWAEDEEKAYCTIASAEMLVLDDLGKGKPTEWALERLFRLIDRRYNDLRPTIFTSQYSIDQLADQLAVYDRATAEAIVSRIDEMTQAIEFNGEDMRKKIKYSH